MPAIRLLEIDYPLQMQLATRLRSANRIVVVSNIIPNR
jgi:hypothetical protein